MGWRFNAKTQRTQRSQRRLGQRGACWGTGTPRARGNRRGDTDMTEKHDPTASPEAAKDVSRRDFVALSLAAGLGGGAGTASAALPVVSGEVSIKTPDGTCDAAFI